MYAECTHATGIVYKSYYMEMEKKSVRKSVARPEQRVISTDFIVFGINAAMCFPSDSTIFLFEPRV